MRPCRDCGGTPSVGIHHHLGCPQKIYNSPLDAGIRTAVEALNAAKVETFESCEGGDGHAYPEPTVRFHGDQGEGFRALSVALSAGLKVSALRRTWPVIANEPTGPCWEMTFTPQ